MPLPDVRSDGTLIPVGILRRPAIGKESNVSLDDYAHFLKTVGHRVLMTESSCWFNASSGAYLNLPFHRPISPGPSEIRKVIGKVGIIVRYTCPVEVGRPSYKLSCYDKNYGYDSLLQKGRNRTRRGMESCSVRRLDFHELEAVKALDLNRDTLLRQGRRVPANHDHYWRTYYSAAAESHSMEAWGAFVGDDLAAYLIACKIEDCMNVLYVHSHRNYLKANPNNALFFIFTRDALSRKEITEVCLGLESPQPDLQDLDRFKLRMGYTKVPMGQRIEFNPLLRWFLGGSLQRNLQAAVSKVHGRENFAKLAGVLQWHSEQPVRSAQWSSLNVGETKEETLSSPL